MRAGYPWTQQLAHFLPLVLSVPDDSAPGTKTALLEILGGLEMDCWILHRKSEPLHIWANYCRGQEGVEDVTGLPRRLLDLISLVSWDKNVEGELKEYSAYLSARADANTPSVTVWRCFALAAQIHSQCRMRLQQPTGRVDELFELIRDLRYRLAPSDQAVLAWPAQTLGQHTRDPQHHSYIENIITTMTASYLVGIRDKVRGLTLMSLMERKEQENSRSSPAEASVGGNNLEIGLW
jgi:hypothetical protein